MVGNLILFCLILIFCELTHSFYQKPSSLGAFSSEWEIKCNYNAVLFLKMYKKLNLVWQM